MFTKDQHLDKAERNEAFALTQDHSVATPAEWAITANFYSALHYIQAYFVSVGKNYVTHDTRDSALRRDPKLAPIYDDYRELKSLSREARYDCSTLSKGHVKYAGERLGVVKTAVWAVI